MITGICSVVFTTVSGGRKLVRMNSNNFAHLVSDFLKKKKSPFKEDFEFRFAGETIVYSGFGLRRRSGPGFFLEYSV